MSDERCEDCKYYQELNKGFEDDIRLEMAFHLTFEEQKREIFYCKNYYVCMWKIDESDPCEDFEPAEGDEQ